MQQDDLVCRLLEHLGQAAIAACMHERRCGMYKQGLATVQQLVKASSLPVQCQLWSWPV